MAGKDGKAFVADKKNLWLSWLIMKKATEDRSCTLIFEVNSVQCLLLFNAFLAKQWGIKLEITSSLIINRAISKMSSSITQMPLSSCTEYLQSYHTDSNQGTEHSVSG